MNFSETFLRNVTLIGSYKEKHGPQPKADDNKPKKLTEKLTAPLKMESVTIIFSMFRLVTVGILSYGVR